jgi:hypothetical protein
MKTLKFKKTSWHYELASKAGFRDYDSQDLCTYITHIFWAFVAIFFIIGASSILGAILIHTVLGAIFSFIAGSFIFTETGVAGLILTVAGVLFGFVWCVFEGFRIAKRKAEKTYGNNPDSFVANAYRSWKDKMCFKIEIQ